MSTNKNILEQYRRISAVKDQCIDNVTGYFVAHGEGSTTVHNTRTDDDLVVNIVMNDAEGPDKCIVFSNSTTDLQKGDYIIWKNTTYFLLYEDIGIIKEVDYNKFKAYECNVLINKTIHGYFIGSVKSAKDITMKNNYEVSKLLPTIVIPITAGLQIGDHILINDQAWDIVEADLLSNSGIGYYYIERGTNTMSSTVKTNIKDKANVLYKGATTSINTENGYYSANVALDIVARTKNLITFVVPESDFTITTKQNGELTSFDFIVKENV